VEWTVMKELEKTDHDLCGHMILCKKRNACFRSKILEEPKLNSLKFERLCNVIVSVIQRLTGTGLKVMDMRGS